VDIEWLKITWFDQIGHKIVDPTLQTCLGNNSKVASNQTHGKVQLTGFLTNQKSPKKE
jgi:hypothetical protein